MKKLLLLISLFICNPLSSHPSSNNSPSSARGGGWGVVSSLYEAPDCTTFTVDNASSYSLGTVTVSGVGYSTDFNVTVAGFYPQEICYTALSVTVCGVSVPYPTTADVQLPSGDLVTVKWQSTNAVEIANTKTEGLSAQ